MNQKLADQIYKEVEEEWNARHGRQKLNPTTLKMVKNIIHTIPDEDGCKRITNMETGKTHLVPIKYIILDGIQGDELHKYPEEKK